jgi:flagellar secretion chaperone FliS
MHVANPWKSYRQIATQTAPPGQLVLMLYDGALRFLERAVMGFRCEDPAEANMAVHNNLQRAIDIIRELNLALDLDKGGQCAVTLRELYEYFDRRLWESNVQKRSEGVHEVIQHLTVLRDAWASMLSGQNHAELAAMPQPTRSSELTSATV